MSAPHIQTPKERKIWRRCFWAGLATLILGAIVLVMFPSQGGPYPQGYGTPIIALEFAQTTQQAQQVIGYDSTPSWNAYNGAMIKGTIADMPFLLIYGLFLVSFFHAAYTQTALKLYKFFAAIALISALADLGENLGILGFLLEPESTSAEGRNWHYFAKAKFMALALSGIGAAIFLLRQPRTLRKIEGVFAAGGGALTLFALTRPEQIGNMLGLGVTLCWIAMLAYAATQAFKKV